MNLYWLDLETTGLDPRSHQILEIAVAQATLENPFTISRLAHIVLPVPTRTVLDPFIVDMHTKNGLLAECDTSTWTVKFAEDHIAKLIPAESDRENMPTLAGSVVHFDHAFLRAHMPTLASRFSHRTYDVSAIKLFCRSLGMEKPPKAEAHRAMADVEESVAHAKLCAEWLWNRHTWRVGVK